MKLVDDNGNIVGVVVDGKLRLNISQEDLDELNQLITDEIDNMILEELKAAFVNMPQTPNVDTQENEQ